MELIGVGESLWLSLTKIEKMLDHRSKQCVDCGCPYEIIPFDRGRYQCDNEPDTTTTYTTPPTPQPLLKNHVLCLS